MSSAAGVPVRLIDGIEEARLAFIGMRASVSIRPNTVLALDLGGGSLDLAAGTATDVAWAASLPLGVSRLTGELVRSDPLSRADRAALRRRVRSELDRVRDRLEAAGAGRAITIGGTGRALARMVGSERWDTLPPSINQMEVGLEELQALTKRLCAADRAERLDMAGMDERRVDYLAAGAVILTTVLGDLGYRAMTVSEWGLREGVALHEAGLDGSAEGLRRAEVERLRGPGDHAHADRVAVLAVQLFDDTAEIHRMGRLDREMLEHASALHDLGRTEDEAGQHKRGASILRRAGLRGFTPEEVAVLASLVRYQRGTMKSGRAPLSLLDDETGQRVQCLVAMLRVAHALDEGQDGAVRGVAADVRDGVLVLDVDGPGPFVAASEEASRHLATLEAALGIPVELHAPLLTASA
jgi:exopolyphosphatase/guanosine-5'-triphosphate,3'-diphosphate pyrophosphatase